MKLIPLLLAFISISTISLSQTTSTDTVLVISGEVTTPLKLTMADLMKLPHKIVRGLDHDRHEYDFEGIDVSRLLSLAGVRFADTLKGTKFASSLLVVRATDNYQAVFTLAELDPTNSDNQNILAYRQDDKPLGSKDGLLRFIALGDKRHIRWVRQVQSFIVQQIK